MCNVLSIFLYRMTLECEPIRTREKHATGKLRQGQSWKLSRWKISQRFFSSDYTEGVDIIEKIRKKYVKKSMQLTFYK